MMYVSESLGYYDMPGIVLDYFKSVVATAAVMFLGRLDLKNILIRRFLDFTDKYSYGIYLTHHIFILGSLSVMGLTPLGFLNGVGSFILAITTGIILIRFSDRITIFIKKRITNR